MVGKGSKGLWKYSTGISWLSPGLELNDLGYMNSSDEIENENEISYMINQPSGIFRTYSIALEQNNTWNFNGDYLGSGAEISFLSEFKNQWGFLANIEYNTKETDTKILRGGYAMLVPYRIEMSGALTTDQSKKFTASIEYGYEYRGNNSAKNYEIHPGITYRPVNNLKLGVTANYIDNYDQLQYVATNHDIEGNRYIMGTIDQKTLGLTFRVDLNLTPEFSIQYYGSPFVSLGSYSNLKYITDPKAKDYDGRFNLYDGAALSDGVYQLYDNYNGSRVDYTVADPDFNFHEFRSNLVAKWEYRLGSFIYLVWSSEKSGYTSLSKASLGDSYKQLKSVFPNNIFLIKLNYWFSL
jgi:hypothetical protein